MKVCLVLENFDPGRGGMEQWTAQFARSLVAIGHEVHVAACHSTQVPDARGVIFHHVPFSRSPIRRAEAFEQFLQTKQFDIVHDMACGWRADIFHPHSGSTKAEHEHNLLRIPSWRRIRFWREKRYREREKIERRQHADPKATTLAVSHMVKRHLRQYHGLPEDRVRVIHNGVDTQKFSPEACAARRHGTRDHLGFMDVETVFLMVAHNLLLKNADTAIRAFAQLARSGQPVRLAIVGGKRPEPFAKLARKLGVADKVHFYPTVDDVIAFYSAADAFLLPTWYDPCSLVVLEAMACGLPGITTLNNGASEMIDTGTNGFVLAEPANAAQLAGVMSTLLDRDRRSMIGVKARKTMELQTLDRQTDQILALYSEIIARRE